jgi:hypothetical protein
MNVEIQESLPYINSFICPHCNTRAQFNLIFPQIDRKRRDEYAANMKTAIFVEDDSVTYTYLIWRCQVCEKLVFRASSQYSTYGDAKIVGQFPSGIRIDSAFVDCVPPEILVDYESALKCYEFDEYRPSAAMCRRALQASVLEQGADPSNDLFTQIDELNKKNPDRFTNDIKDWAHSIRIFGNWGAHPDKDGLKDVNKEIAMELLEFMKSYFRYVYQMPKKVAEARQKQNPQKPSP